MYRWFWASTLHGVGPPSRHVMLISHVTSRTILFELSKETSFSIAITVTSHVPSCILPSALMALVNHQDRSNTQDSIVHFCTISVWSQSRLRVPIRSYCPREYHLRSHLWSIPFGSSYPNRECCPQHWNLRKFFFLSEHPLELLDQENRVRKHNTSKVMKHNPILQDAMSPTHGRKSGMGDWEVFLIQLFHYPACYAVNASFIVSCAPFFVNLMTIFLLRGEGSNIMCYSFPNHLH
jgi:hypothetical protein